jgi:hypothetical protein
VLLGLLGNETARPGVGTAQSSGQAAPDRCGAIPPPVNAIFKPGSCIVVGSIVIMEAGGFTPGEEVNFYISREDGRVSQQKPIRANTQGKAGFGAVFDVPGGLYGIVLEGLQSGNKAVAYVRVVER